MTAISRVFNVVCAAAGLVVLSPLFAAAALTIKCDDGGPVFYAQRRIGRGFRPFRLFKFRSMAVNADQAGPLTAPADPRLTRAGRFLRKCKLDEIPQLWNVLIGDMQLVGPRPEVPQYVEIFREQYALLLSEAPGITDPASLAYRNEEKVFAAADTGMEDHYITQILPDKLRLSLAYRCDRGLFSDLRVLLETVFSLTP